MREGCSQERLGERGMGLTYNGDDPKDLMRSLRAEVENKIHWLIRDGPASGQPIAGMDQQELDELVANGEATGDQLKSLGQIPH